VAHAVTLAHWEGHDVRLGAVLDWLDKVRRQTARSASRTSVLTLVIVTVNDDQAAEASRVMAAFGAHHPTRVVVLEAKPDAADAGVDARLTVYGDEVGLHPVSFEEIALQVRAAGCAHLD
jgi:hypothetical protein